MQRIGSRIKKTLISTLFTKKAFLSLATIAPVFAFFVLPVLGYTDPVGSNQEALYSPSTNFYNSQTLALLNSKERPLPKGGVGGADPIMTEDGALMADVSPITDVNPEAIDPDGPKDISVYTVREGDTLSDIAEMFNIKQATIRGFNNIRKDSDLRVGMELLILPIDGISYKVVKGDTLEKIAAKYAMNKDEIAPIKADIELFNDLTSDADLMAGTEIVIPNVEAKEPSAPVKKPSTSTAPQKGGKSYFVRAWGGVQTQGFHDKYRGKDWGMPLGSKIGASAAGTVIVAREGWNGGYGTFVIIKHPNGAQTLYAHLSKLAVSVGQNVAQKETIGYSGSTGRSTGPHLHFEIRGWGDIPF